MEINDGIRIVAKEPDVSSALRLTADSEGHVAAVTSSGKLIILQNSKVKETASAYDEKFISAEFSDDGKLFAATESNKIFVFSIKDENNLQFLQTINCGSMNHINSLSFYENVLFLCSDSGVGYIDYKKDNSFHLVDTDLFNNSIDNMIEDYQGNLWFSSSRLGLLRMCETAFAEIYLSADFQKPL